MQSGKKRTQSLSVSESVRHVEYSSRYPLKKAFENSTGEMRVKFFVN